MNQKFLEALFPDLKGGFIEVRLIHPTNKTIQPHFYPSIEELIAHQSIIDECSKDFNVYFGVCPRSEKKGNKESVKIVWCLWTDLDFKDFECGRQGALNNLNSFLISPTIVVESGNGFHVYWRLKEAFEIKSNEDIFKIEKYLKALAQALGGDPASAELARILRLPGTLNHKNLESQQIVKVVEFNPGQQCNLEDFESILTIHISSNNQKTNAIGWIEDTLSNMQEGNRNASFAKIAGRLHHDKWTQSDIIALLAPHAEKSHFPLQELMCEVEGICKRYPNGNSFPSSTNNSEKTEKECRPFVAVRLFEFLNQGSEKIEWAIERILPQEAVGILAGPAGYGKSWMMLDLAIEYAQGGLWLNKFMTKKGKVLYIDEESSTALLRKRLNKLLNGKNMQKDSLEIDFIVGQGLCFTDKSSVAQLREIMKSHSPNLVIIDSLIRVHGAEENSAKEMSKVFGIVKEIVREFKCAFLFCDHQRKPNYFITGNDFLLRGSTEKVAFVDSLLSLRRKDKFLITEHSKSRFDEAIPAFLVNIHDPSPESTKVFYAGEAEAQLQEERLKTVADFLKSALDHGDWVSRKDLVEKAKSIPISEKMVDESLKNHLESGLIERDDRKSTQGAGGKAAFYRWKINNIPSLFPITEIETEKNSATA